MSGKTRSIYAALPRTTRGLPIVIGGDPKGKNFLYTNGNSVIIRNIENPSIAEVYTEHSVQAIVAKYSPSGFYIASGDVSGKVRIWDTTQKEHLLKNEFQPIAGTIKDIAWSPDNQRIVVVGEGREKYGHVFMADTGTSVGEISGQSKAINSVDFRPTRPFRIVTASEDNTIAFFHGPPFKFNCTGQDHTRFAQAVRFSPNGENFVSAGADGRVLIYNGTTAERIGEFGSPAHKGGVYAVAWSPDNSQLITASGDKTCRLWDVGSSQLITEFQLGSEIEDMQLGCLWQGQYIISISLSGFINYLDPNNPARPYRIVKGHNKSITAMVLSDDKADIFTGSHDGFITRWDSATGMNERIIGKGHSNQVQDMTLDGPNLITCGMDDTVRYVDLNSTEYACIDLFSRSYEIRLESMPRGIAAGPGGVVVVASMNHVEVLQNGRKLNCTKVEYEPSCVAIHNSESDVAVGGSHDYRVHIYLLMGGVLSPKTTLDHLGAITDVTYSPDGNYLAVCDAYRKIMVYSLPNYERAHSTEWGFHTAKINCISWSPDSRQVASGSLDTCIMIWSMDNPNKHITIKNAHPMSQITRLAWLDDFTLISTGQDCNTKIWDICQK